MDWRMGGFFKDIFTVLLVSRATWILGWWESEYSGDKMNNNYLFLLSHNDDTASSSAVSPPGEKSVILKILFLFLNEIS